MAAKKTPTRKPQKTLKPKNASKAKKPVIKAKKASAKKAPAGGAKKAAPKGRTGKRAPLKARRAAAKTTRRAEKSKAKPRAPKLKSTRAVPENAEGLALAQLMANVALDKKAEGVVIIDVREKGSAVGYDYLVIASADSDRQLGAIAEGIDQQVKLMHAGRRATSVEASSDWVLVNYDDVLGHFFSTEKRSAYDLEGIWTDAPRVKVKA